MINWKLTIRNKVEDAKIEEPVTQCLQSPHEDVQQAARDLLSYWSGLQSAYRIPRKIVVVSMPTQAHMTSQPANTCMNLSLMPLTMLWMTSIERRRHPTCVVRDIFSRPGKLHQEATSKWLQSDERMALTRTSPSQFTSRLQQHRLRPPLCMTRHAWRQSSLSPESTRKPEQLLLRSISSRREATLQSEKDIEIEIRTVRGRSRRFRRKNAKRRSFREWWGR